MVVKAVIDYIQNHINQNGGNYKEWWIGITSNPKQRLFTEHKVDEKYGLWVHAPADSNEIARQVENYFLRLGCDGGPGGGDYTSKTVYAYKRTDQTVQ